MNTIFSDFLKFPMRLEPAVELSCEWRSKSAAPSGQRRLALQVFVKLLISLTGIAFVAGEHEGLVRRRG
ncbi:MAG: hypothetical protein NTW21_39690 [Verrucomicrobia bacterium]|nr:hypothetical protein [Verrucomicrobiota bacterium]